MNRRLARARRVLAAQTELDRLAAWRLVDLERQGAAMDERRAALLRFLDAESSFSGPFAGAMMRRLEAVEAARAAVRLERAAQTERRLAESARTRCAASVVTALETAARRSGERSELAEAIDAALGRQAQGSGKFDGSSSV